MIDIILDDKAIEIMSTLIAKMESITFDERRTCVFRTPWGRSLFATCSERMLQKRGESARPFDIDEWFRSSVRHSARVHRDIDPSAYQQPIDTDWLSALMELELRFLAAGNVRGSLLKVLHNILELEDAAQSKLSKYCKSEKQYDFEGVLKVSPSSSSSQTKFLMSAPAPPPKPGSIDDLLSRKK
jgi:hypothetical protein